MITFPASYSNDFPQCRPIVAVPDYPSGDYIAAENLIVIEPEKWSRNAAKFAAKRRHFQ
jgi:hypothetical protein